MADRKIASKGGLEGVSVADSSIGMVDGVKGELRYCGYFIKDLAEHSDFAETTWLLWHRELPTRSELEGFRTELKAHRALPGSTLDLLRDLAPRIGSMGALRTVVSALGADDIPGDDTDPGGGGAADFRFPHSGRSSASLPGAGRHAGNSPLSADNLPDLLCRFDPGEELSRRDDPADRLLRGGIIRVTLRPLPDLHEK